MTTETTGGADARLDDDALFDALAAGGEIPTEAAPAEQQTDPPPAPEPATAELAAPPQPPPPPQPAAQEDHRVPLRELLDERERRQALQRQLAEMEARLPKPEAPKQPEFWEAPEQTIEHRVQAAVQPIQAALIAQNERMSQMMAESQHGADAVRGAYADLERRFAEGDPSAAFDKQRIMSSPHPYGALVELHKQRVALQEIGPDPAAYRQRIMDDALKNPAFLAKALEAANAAARQNPVVSPLSPRPAAVSLPSVNRMGAAAPIGGSQDDLDDDALFEQLAAKPSRRRG